MSGRIVVRQLSRTKLNLNFSSRPFSLVLTAELPSVNVKWSRGGMVDRVSQGSTGV